MAPDLAELNVKEIGYSAVKWSSWASSSSIACLEDMHVIIATPESLHRAIDRIGLCKRDCWAFFFPPLQDALAGTPCF